MHCLKSCAWLETKKRVYLSGCSFFTCTIAGMFPWQSMMVTIPWRWKEHGNFGCQYSIKKVDKDCTNLQLVVSNWNDTSNFMVIILYTNYMLTGYNKPLRSPTGLLQTQWPTLEKLFLHFGTTLISLSIEINSNTIWWTHHSWLPQLVCDFGAKQNSYV